MIEGKGEKPDITKMVVTVEFTKKKKKVKGQMVAVNAKFEIPLQEWIKKTPEQQDDYIRQHTKESTIDYKIV